jgi:tetratricopeptide (TPR) repeat protein
VLISSSTNSAINFVFKNLSFAIIASFSLFVYGANESRSPACTLMKVAELDIIANQSNSLLIPVLLDEKPSALVLDTGAFWSLLREGVIGDLKSRNAPIQMLGAGGGEIGQYVKLASMQIGAMRFKNAEFFVGSDAITDDERVGGNLGANILKGFDLEIDPGRNKVNLFSPKRCEGSAVYWPEIDATSIPFDFDDGWITIPVVLDGKPIRALLDTGASSSILNLLAAKKIFGLTPQSQGVESSDSALTLDGKKLELYKYQFKSLQIGDVTFANPWLNLSVNHNAREEKRNLGTKAPALILGMHQLRKLHLYIAYAEKTIYMSSVAGDAAADAEKGIVRADLSHKFRSPLDYKNAQPYLTSALDHLNKGEFDAALQDLQHATNFLPNDAEVRSLRGYVYLQKTMYSEAIDEFDRALTLDDSDAKTYFNRAVAYKNRNDFSRAHKDLAKAIELDPQIEDANFYRAAMYLQSGEILAAMPDLDRALILNPQSQRALSARCWALAEQQQPKAALSDCNAAIAADAGDIGALTVRAALRLQAGMLTAAIQDYSSVLELQPSNASALYARGRARQQSGDAAGGGDMRAAKLLNPSIEKNFNVIKSIPSKTEGQQLKKT